MNIDMAVVNKLRKDLEVVSKKIFARGLTSGQSGNPSARVPGYPEQVLIKASGKCFGDVCENDFVLIDLDGNVLDGDARPSKEWKFHCGIYKVRPEVNAIVHGHSPYATAYATAKGEMPVVTAAAEAGLNKVGVVGFALPGSDELAELVVKAFEEDKTLKAAVLDKHGFVTLGDDIYKAYYLGDVLEDNAKTASIIASFK